NNIDHAIHRICAPQAAPWTTDDFNSIQILQHHILRIPEHTRKQGRINAASIYKYQQLVGKRIIKAAGGACVVAGIYPCDLQTWCQTQSCRYRRGTRPANVMLSNTHTLSWLPRQGCRLFGSRRNPQLSQLLKRQVSKGISSVRRKSDDAHSQRRKKQRISKNAT